MIHYHVKFVRTSLHLIANVKPRYTSQSIFTAFSTFLKPDFAASVIDGTAQSKLAESPRPLNCDMQFK
jgi:hypothetical protein